MLVELHLRYSLKVADRWGFLLVFHDWPVCQVSLSFFLEYVVLWKLFPCFVLLNLCESLGWSFFSNFPHLPPPPPRYGVGWKESNSPQIPPAVPRDMCRVAPFQAQRGRFRPRRWKGIRVPSTSWWKLKAKWIYFSGYDINTHALW